MNGLRVVATLWLLGTLPVPGAGSAPEHAEPWTRNIGLPYYVAVSVADVDRAAAWYRSAFGLETLDDTKADDGSWRIVNLANARLFVEIIHDRADRPVERARGIAKVGFGVDDVAAVADRVAKATGTRPRIHEDARHGLRFLQVRDPDGNILQLASRLEAAKN